MELVTLSDALLADIRSSLPSVKVPGAYDAVHNDECIYSTDTPFAPGGIFISLTTWRAYNSEDVLCRAGGDRLFLNLAFTRVQREAKAEDAAAAAETKPTKLAIGVAGGFDADASAETTEKSRALLVLPGRVRVALPCAELPELVLRACEAIEAHASVHDQAQVGAWEETVQVSKYAKDLVQEEGVRISADPSTWVCADSGLRENLWLNLSDGYIGSGRAQAYGVGGTGAALRHYEQLAAQGKHYPLVVKLGTISAKGADVYSYAPDENDSVVDPHLAEHLAKLGINAMALEKTEKTVTELQIALNQSFEFDQITEAGRDLVPLSAPGLVGIANLGNSCYLNASLQLLFAMPEARARFYEPARSWFDSARDDASSDLQVQLAKLAVGLLSSRYVQPEPAAAATTADCVQPRMLKAALGKGHVEFASSRQQDCLELLQHLLDRLERADHADKARIASALSPAAAASALPPLFKFEVEERTACGQTGAVRYVRRAETVLSLPIPLAAASNMDAVRASEAAESAAKRQRVGAPAAADGAAADPVAPVAVERVRPVIAFDACVGALAADEEIDDFYSSAAKAKGRATKRLRLVSFPRYLLVQMRRYYVGDDWTARKLDARVPAPERLSLEAVLRAHGVQHGETLMPDDDTPPAAAAAAARAEPSEEIVAALVSMGFSHNGSRRAALATGNASTEASMEWVLSHMHEDGFDDPLDTTQPTATPAAAGGGAAAAAAEPSVESVEMLAGMGFGAQHAAAALKHTSGDIERAADWLFSHMDDLDGAIKALDTPAASAAAGGERGTTPAGGPLDDGVGEYELIGFASHMGANLGCGHYVAHVRHQQDDGTARWVLFNDKKVALSEAPPLDLGYMYLYRRTTPSTKL